MVKTSKQRIEGNSSIDKGYLQKRTINISNNKILKSFPLKSEGMPIITTSIQLQNLTNTIKQERKNR